MHYLEFECSPCVVSLFESIGGEGTRFIYEDVSGGTALVGAHPMFVLSAKNGADPLGSLQKCLERFKDDTQQADIPFAGGAVGYFSYDLGRSIESVPVMAVEDVPTPDFYLGFYDSALYIDAPKRRCIAVSWSGDREAVRYWQRLAMAAPEAASGRLVETVHCPGALVDIRSNFSRNSYIRTVERVKEYIAAGDVYQVNLSQRFEAELQSSPWSLYKALRRINPAPKSCFMEGGELTLASASPEVYLTYDRVSRIVTTKPIKGTRPRGKTVEEDDRLAQELAESEKDRAESVMIVDMERNDLGRVAEFGSVRVPELWKIEKHPNVFQMVSTVEAKLAQEYGPVDLLRASFPGGSITGAPKVRAMEIIEELEPHRRGIYTGSAGFIDFRGYMDFSIVIRSFVTYQNRAFFHGGGGIVIDSDPRAEYQETLDKICGLRAALEKSKGD